MFDKLFEILAETAKETPKSTLITVMVIAGIYAIYNIDKKTDS